MTKIVEYISKNPTTLLIFVFLPLATISSKILHFWPGIFICGMTLVFLPGFRITYLIYKQYRSFFHNKLTYLERLIYFSLNTYMISLIFWPPLYIAILALFLRVDLLFFSLVIVIGLELLYIYLSKQEKTKGLKTTPYNEKDYLKHNSDPAAQYLLFFVLILTFLINLTFNIHYIFFSFSNEIFLINDIAMYLAVMQSISHAVWPFRELLASGRYLTSNFLILTEPFIFYGFLLGTSNLQRYIIYFLITTNALTHTALVFYSFITVKIAITKERFLKSTIILIFLFFMGGTPIASFITLIKSFPKYEIKPIILIYELLPSGKTGVLGINSVGMDSFILAFHHDVVYLIYLFELFLVYMILHEKNTKSTHMRVVFLNSIMSFYLLLSHIGIGLFFALPLLLITFLLLLDSLFSKDFLNIYILIAISTVMLFFVFVLSKIEPFSNNYLVTFKIRNLTTLFATISNILTYNGAYFVFALIGFWVLTKRSFHKYFRTFLLLPFLFQNMFITVFNLFRVFNESIQFADYYPWMASQIPLLILAGIGFNRLMIFLFEDIPVFEKGIIAKIKSFYVILTRPGSNKWKKIIVLFLVLTISVHIGSSLLNLDRKFSKNLGLFYYKIYGRVILVDTYEMNAYTWILVNTPSNSVFIVSIENWEIVALAGRAVVYAGYRIKPESERYIDTMTFFTSANYTLLFKIIEKYGVTHIMITKEDIEKYGPSLLSFLTTNSDKFTIIYQNEKVYVYSVNKKT
ncbi:MAG: hypothetical protein ACP6IS_10695 [Candidatus Asgardarchaeia archaeon]